MGVLSIMLHRNPDGDRWLLVPWPDQEAYRVVHIESERAGGHIAIFEVDASCSTFDEVFLISRYGKVCAPHLSPMSSESHWE